MCQCSTSIFENSLVWMYCHRHAGVKWNDSRETDGQNNHHKRRASRKIWSVEELDIVPWAQSQGRYTVDFLEERGMKRGIKRSMIFLEVTRERPSSFRWTLELFQRRRWGHFWETVWSAYGLLRANRYRLELNWTDNLGLFSASLDASRPRSHNKLVLSGPLALDG